MATVTPWPRGKEASNIHVLATPVTLTLFVLAIWLVLWSEERNPLPQALYDSISKDVKLHTIRAHVTLFCTAQQQKRCISLKNPLERMNPTIDIDTNTAEFQTPFSFANTKEVLPSSGFSLFIHEKEKGEALISRPHSAAYVPRGDFETVMSVLRDLVPSIHQTNGPLPAAPRTNLAVTVAVQSRPVRFSTTTALHDWECVTLLKDMLSRLAKLSTFTEILQDIQPGVASKFSKELQLHIIQSTEASKLLDQTSTHFAHMTHDPNPILKFVIFVPTTPTVFVTPDGQPTSWLKVEGFGTIVFANPGLGSPASSSERADIKALFEPISDALRHLLAPHATLERDVSPSFLFGKAEVMNMQRLQTQATLKQTLATIGSIFATVKQQPDLPVPLEVAESVASSLSFIQQSLEAGTPSDALGKSLQSLAESTAAATHSGMIGGIFMPEFNVAAIYLPLLLPLCIQLVYLSRELLVKIKASRK